MKRIPKIDLADAVVRARQHAHVKAFAKRQQLLWLCAAIVPLVFFGLPALLDAMALGDSQTKDLFVTLFVIGSIAATTFAALRYKCPNCGATPTGSSWFASGGEVTTARGLHPFPSRCEKCGSYLSATALNVACQENHIGGK